MHELKKLFSKDSTLIVLFLVLGVAGLALFHMKQESIFPSASIDLSINKAEILKLASDWSKRFGYNKKELIESETFNDDDQAKTFLEYELGNTQANALMKSTVPVFFWQCQFRKAFDQETMDVQISPAGKLLAADFQLPNDKKLPSIDHTAAEDKALAFVKEVLGWEQNDCKLVEDETTPRANRTDHKFTWELQKLDWHGAKLRADVDVSGDMLSRFNYYLKRPEKWDRDYSTIRTKNELLYSIASIFFFALYAIGVFICLRGISKGTIRWRFSAIVAIVLTSITMLENLNNFPTTLSGYKPDTSFPLFIVGSIVYPIISAPFIALFIAAITAAGELVYRHTFPERIALENLLTKSGMRSKEVIVGTLIGLFWFGASLGYQIIYYWLGSKVHFWCPLEVGDYQVLSSFCPWFSALSLSVFAATNEEILYRVLMLGLLKPIVRNFWIANILQAVAWGFMHSTYPQQPCYARGLELSIEGAFDGWLLQRFGLVACLVSHYAFDAFQSVTPLFNAPIALKFSAVFPFVPILAVLAYGVINYQKHKLQSQDITPLLNKALDQPPSGNKVVVQEKVESSPALIYQPISSNIRVLIACLSVIGFAVLAQIGHKSYSVGVDKQSFNITRDEAIEKSQKYLKDFHLNLDGYKIGTSVGGSTSEGHEQVQYLFEQIGFKKTDALVKEIDGGCDWLVRFVKPLAPSEYTCILDANGKLLTTTMSLGEDEPGAELSQADAQKIAENFIKTHRSLYVPFEFDGTTTVKRKHRLDQHFVFKVPKYRVGEAQFKVGIDVLGNMPSNMIHYWDLPDNWEWERTKRSNRQEIANIISAIVSAASSVAFAIWIIYLFKADKIRWRTAMIGAGLFTVCNVISGLNALPAFFTIYRSTVPLNTWYAICGTGGIVGVLLGWGALALGIAVILAGNSDALKSTLKKTWAACIASPLGQPPSQSRFNLFLDAVIFACAMLAFSGLTACLKGALGLALRHEVSLAASPGSVMGLANDFVGPLQILVNLSLMLLAAPLSVGLGVAICKLLRLTNYWRFGAAVLLVYVITGLGDRYWQDFLVGLISCIATLTGVWFVAVVVLKRNYLTLFMWTWLYFSFGLVTELWKFGQPVFWTDLIFACCLLSLPFLYLLWLYLSTYLIKRKTL